MIYEQLIIFLSISLYLGFEIMLFFFFLVLQEFVKEKVREANKANREVCYLADTVASFFVLGA